MFILKNLYVKQEKAGGDEGGQGGGGAPNGGGDEGGQGGGELTLEQLQEQNKTLAEETERMRAKMDELLGETKKAKEAKREAERLAAIEAEEKAKKAGDFEQLYKSAEEKNKELASQLDGLRQGINKEKTQSAVNKIASELAEGDDVQNLALLIGNRLKYHDNEIKVLNESGELTVSTIDDLKNEIKSTSRFKSLLKGSQASGGGANGNNGGKAITKTATRAEFEAMDQMQRSKFFSSGGKII